MTKFANTLAVVARRDKSQWELGDALIEDIGEPLLENGKNDGSYAMVREASAILAEEGYDYTVDYLQKLRVVAHNFKGGKRLRATTWAVHMLAGTPEMLDVIVSSARLRDNQRLTFRKAKVILETIKERERKEREQAYEQERQTAKAEGRKPIAPRPMPRKTVPPQNTKPVSKSDIAVTQTLHQIMALIARAQGAEQQARELLESNLTAFVPEAYDALVEQSLVVANKWREFSTAAGRTQRTKRGHLSVVNE